MFHGKHTKTFLHAFTERKYLAQIYWSSYNQFLVGNGSDKAWCTSRATRPKHPRWNYPAVIFSQINTLQICPKNSYIKNCFKWKEKHATLWSDESKPVLFLAHLKRFIYSPQFKTGQDQSLNCGQKKKKKDQRVGEKARSSKKMPTHQFNNLAFVCKYMDLPHLLFMLHQIPDREKCNSYSV